ncbi:MAG: C10 family peptidase [Bacteroidaceae bacterium]|nr:C10 family peptidase [Bacteroidaceae bacterium]
MNKRFTFTRIVMTLFLALFCVSSTWAEDITLEQALKLAQNFISKQQVAPGKPRMNQGTAKQLTLASKVSGLYIFNVENDGGYIIVSNDDRTRPILGFSESGSFKTEDMPDNMKAWLQGYADEIAWVQQHGSVAPPKSDKVGTHSTNPVTPLVTSKWNQGTPYNNLCPTYSGWGGSGKCATGCVATAMAQVMNYHKWPTKPTKTIPGYTTATQGLNLSSLSPVNFDWSHMRDSYSGSYTNAEATAVATLMKYCGYSVKMDYDESSGAYTEDVAIALREYFDYNPYTTRFVSRSSYTYENWTDMIYHEVSHGRPVCYGGLSSGGGHEFVCDGYKFESNTDFFHINWGWGGLSDNYFVLSALDPDQQGIGGSTSTDGFHYGQDAVIGIQKSTASGTIANIDPNENNITLNSITLSETPVDPGTTVNIIFNVTNNSADPYDGDIWLCLREGDNDYLIDLESVVIPGNTTQDVSIPYTPTQTGTYTFLFCYINADGEYVVSEAATATLVVVQNLTNGVVPVYGYWVDNYTKSQFIIAEANIEDMVNSTITSMTFTATQNAVSWGSAKFDVYISETNDNTINSLKSWSTMEKVYSGSLSVVNKKMKVTFSEPFYYQGGNLLVGFNQTQTGSYAQVSWKGEEVAGVSIGGYGSSISQQNFLPTTEFEFTPGSTVLRAPRDLLVSHIRGTEATVSWTSYAPSFDIEVNGTVTENVSNPVTLTGLEIATPYIIKVRARDGEEVSDWSEAVTFTTSLSETTCQIRLELSDTMGDGWNGDAAIKIVDVLTGTELGTFTCTDEAGKNEIQEYYVEVPDDRDIEFQWVKGIYDHECIYAAYDVNGNLIFAGTKRLKNPVSYHVNCSTEVPCEAPTNFAAVEFTTSTVTLTWDSGMVKYDLRYKPLTEPAEEGEEVIEEPDEGWTEIDGIEANIYELTDLSQATTYVAQLRGYCEADGEASEWTSSISFTTINGNIFVTAGDWNEGTNWSGGEVPEEGSDVIIRANVNVPAGIIAEAGNITIEEEATITIQDGGQFKTTSDDVTVTMIKHITPYTEESNGYSLIASPMAELEYAEDLTVDCYYDLYFFQNSEQLEWRNYKTEEFSFTNGTGYLYANSTERDIQFCGTVMPTNVDATFSLLYQGEDFPGFALVGNPFPCNAYFTDSRPFYRMNAEGTELVLATSRVIAPMEAVFVTFDADESITFTTLEPDETEPETEAEEILLPFLPLHDLEEHQDAKEPEIIEIFDIVLSNAGEDNPTIIEEYDGKHCNVTLAGRTLHKDGYWNTICLPFDLKLEGSPLEGGDLRTMVEADVQDDAIVLNFTEEGELDAITAGTPYIIKWDNDDMLTEEQLVFTDVVISSETNHFVCEEGLVCFKGTYLPIAFPLDQKNIRFMSGNSIPSFPLNKGRIGAQQAYFEFAEGVCDGKQFILNLGGDDPTGLNSIEATTETWYDLEGRKLAGKPTRKGIYIRNNKTVTIK